MESNHSDGSIDEPNAKRAKIESEGSTSSKPEAKDPFLPLPSDVLVKIIANIPIAQWPSLELLDQNFLAATLIAWRQLRNVNLAREFFIKRENPHDRSSIGNFVKLMCEKLIARSPFLTTLSGIVDLNSDVGDLLCEFEHLQSITLGDAKFFDRRGIPFDSAVEFLRSTRSRTSLKEVRLLNVCQFWDDRTVSERFATSLVSGREIEAPFKLEKFTFTSSNRLIYIRLDTMDTSRLTDLRVGKVSIEPQQLIDLIERASELRRIELSFAQRRHANKKVLTALTLHQNLTAIKFDHAGVNYGDNDFRSEFIEMLKAIGRRGKLTSLAMEEYFVRSCGMDINEICSTIVDHIPYLKSIKLDMADINDGIAKKLVVSLAELEEISFKNVRLNRMTANEMRKISELPRLKCLALEISSTTDDECKNSLKYLANATAPLTHLRIRFATSSIGAAGFVKWSDGLASNLQSLMLSGIVAYDDVSVDVLNRFLDKAIQLRVLILHGRLHNRLLTTIARSCPDLEILGAQSSCWNKYTAQHLQQIVDRCSKLKKLGGFGDPIRKKLHLSKYRKIVDVDMEFWKHDFDSNDYE